MSSGDFFRGVLFSVALVTSSTTTSSMISFFWSTAVLSPWFLFPLVFDKPWCNEISRGEPFPYPTMSISHSLALNFHKIFVPILGLEAVCISNSVPCSSSIVQEVSTSVKMFSILYAVFGIFHTLRELLQNA